MDYYSIVNPGTYKHNEQARWNSTQLVLAQQLWRDPMMASMAAQTALAGVPYCHMILDNGAHEGVVVPPNDYLELAKSIRPWGVVLPDTMGAPALESRMRSLIFSARLSHDLPGAMQYYVPQGTSAVEALDEYDWALSNLDPSRYIIGFGSAYLLWEDQQPAGAHAEAGREQQVMEVMQHAEAHRFRFHMLGARWEPTKVFSTYPNIIGIDSIKPCHCAFYHTLYSRAGKESKPAGAEPDRFSDRVAEESLLADNVNDFCSAYGVWDK